MSKYVVGVSEFVDSYILEFWILVWVKWEVIQRLYEKWQNSKEQDDLFLIKITLIYRWDVGQSVKPGHNLVEYWNNHGEDIVLDQGGSQWRWWEVLSVTIYFGSLANNIFLQID